MKKIYLKNFGCQMNTRDSEFIAGLFLEKGYKCAKSPEEADIILFNTCSVRKHAEERAISNMGALLKTADRRKIFGIVGCMAQALKGELFKRLPGINLVCGTGEITRLPELIETCARPGRAEVLTVDNVDMPLPELNPPYRGSKNHAYIYIMRGCNNFCSYCVVPYVRGRERSRNIEDIVEEVESLVQREIKDITLLGQNVNSYKGQKIENREQRDCDFVELLQIINNIKGIEKISFLTSHPKDMSTELFEAIRDLDKVVKHLHLPLQSGSDRILKLMNRGYTRNMYLDLATKARNIIPNLRLTTDIIVGFPTETEKDFNDTLDLMKKIEFNSAYVFKYSPRPGTEAAKLRDDVSKEAKKRRHKILLDLQISLSLRAPQSGAKQSQTKGLLRSLRSLAMTFVISLLVINPLADGRDVSKATFVKDMNILFLEENYAGLVKNAEKNFKFYKLGRKDKKEILYLMGLSYIKLGNFSNAREMFHEILAMTGSEFRQDAYIGIADSYFHEGQFGQAIEAYEDILAMYSRIPRISSIYYNLGMSHKAKNDIERANYYFKKIKEQYDKSFEANKVVYIPTTKKPTYYIIQLGAFKSLKNAKKLVVSLRRKGYDSYIQKTTEDGEIWYRVRGGKFSNKHYAMRLVQKLKKSRFYPKVILD